MKDNFEKLRKMTPDEKKAMQEEIVRAQSASEVQQPVSIKTEKKGFFASLFSLFSRKTNNEDTSSSQPTVSSGGSIPEPA